MKSYSEFILEGYFGDDIKDYLTNKKKCEFKNNKYNCSKSLLIGTVANREILYNEDGNLIPKFGRIEGKFSCASTNKLGFQKLTNCSNFPTYVGDDILLGHNQITDLKGFPKTVLGSIMLNDNKLTSLTGLPKTTKILRLDNNKLTSLKGICSEVEELYITKNPLESLKYLPKIKNKKLNISNCRLKRIDYISNVQELGIYDCLQLETITDLIGKNVKLTIRGTTKRLFQKFVHCEVEAFEPGITKNKFFTNLVNVMISRNLNLEEYEFWPKNFLSKNLLDSVGNVKKFNL